MVTSPAQPDVTSPTPLPRLRLEYLDGLRGLAAIIVVLQHTLFQSNWYGQGSPFLYDLAEWAFQGRASVAIFIVLSGYCLMLPVAQSPDGTLRGGAKEYLRRRARRILPPYYAALFLSLLLIVTIPRLTKTWLSQQWSNALPALTPSAIISHLLLIHNLSPHWDLKINPPMWTVGTEWQIYFFFPFLLLPLWKRFGIGATVAIAFVLGLTPALVLHKGLSAAPWFLGLFALGMTGAYINFRRHASSATWVIRMPWGTTSAFLFSCFAFVATWHHIPYFRGLTHGNPNWILSYFWALDIVIGIATVCLLVFCTEHLRRRGEMLDEQKATPTVLRLLEAKAIVRLGVFSYSIYLVHDPLMALLHLLLLPLHLQSSMLFAVLTLAGFPIVLICAYLFHLVFERPFMGAKFEHWNRFGIVFRRSQKAIE